MTTRLSNQTFNKALTILARRDSDLRHVLKQHGNPPIWRRPAGFKTLVLLILEQQVSLASARAAFDRLSAAVPELTPEHALKLTDARYRKAGVSRQKTRYIRHLSDRFPATLERVLSDRS